jgi:IS30 family transposase
MTVDLLECGITTERGNKYVAAFVETVSGFCFLFALTTKTAEAVAECFSRVILEVGAVEELGSDNGGEFRMS